MGYNAFERKHTEGFFTEADICALYELQKGRCYFCDIPLGKVDAAAAFQIDHLTPISKGGTNWPGNLALACSDCNKRKYDQRTSKLWKRLRDNNGVAWYRDKITQNRSQTPSKSKLTKLRKSQRSELLSIVTERMRAKLTDRISESRYISPSEIDVQVKHGGYYLDIWFNNSCISIPAPAQAEIETWGKTTFTSLADCLIALEAVSGYLKPVR